MGKCFELPDVFPVIEDVIRDLCQRDGEAPHEAIVNDLMKHKRGSILVKAAVVRCPDQPYELVASNMVQWFSQQYTVGELKPFAARFKRRKLNKEPLAKPLFPGIKTESDAARMRIGARTSLNFASASKKWSYSPL